jgi:hypothetical protein
MTDSVRGRIDQLLMHADDGVANPTLSEREIAVLGGYGAERVLEHEQVLYYAGQAPAEFFVVAGTTGGLTSVAILTGGRLDARVPGCCRCPSCENGGEVVVSAPLAISGGVGCRAIGSLA